MADFGGNDFPHRSYSWRSYLCRRLTTSQRNVEGGHQCVAWLAFPCSSFLFTSGFPWFLAWTIWVDGLGLAVRDIVGMRVSISFSDSLLSSALTIRCRIVEYATREQAQNAVNTLSNQSLMGRLVYVREVRPRPNVCASLSHCVR